MKRNIKKGQYLFLFGIIGTIVIIAITLKIREIEKSDTTFLEYRDEIVTKVWEEGLESIKDDPKIDKIQLTLDNGDVITFNSKTSYTYSDKTTKNLNRLYSLLVVVVLLTITFYVSLLIVIIKRKKFLKNN